MSRRIGFGNQGGRRNRAPKIVKMLIVLGMMDAIAMALVIRSVLAENWTGVVVGLVFSALVSGLMVLAILRRARGEQRVANPSRAWEQDEDGRG